MRSISRILCVAVILLVTSLTNGVQAAGDCDNTYESGYIHLDACDFPVPVYTNDPSCLGYAVPDAVDDWNAVSPWPGVDLFEYMGTFSGTDSTGAVFVVPNSGEFGETSRHPTGCTDNCYFVLEIPTTIDDLTVVCTGSPASNEYCARDIVAHEMGHVLGLGHLIDSGESIMYSMGLAGFCGEPSECDGLALIHFYGIDPDAIGFISTDYSVNNKFCSIDVEWETCPGSTNNRVFFQETIGGTLYNQTGVNVGGDSYEATILLPPNSEWRFYISTTIDGDQFTTPWTVVPIGGGKGCLGNPLMSAKSPALPDVFSLNAVPNPFNPTTELSFTTSKAGNISIEIFDMRGHLVRTLLNETRPAGQDAVVWDGRSNAGRTVAAGIYFAIMTTPEQRLVHKVAMIK